MALLKLCALLAGICVTQVCGAQFPGSSIFKGFASITNLDVKRFIPSLRLPSPPVLDDMRIRHAFNNISNGSPGMDRNSFSSALGRLHLGICSCEIKEIFLDMDENHDGHVSFEVNLLGSCTLSQAGIEKFVFNRNFDVPYIAWVAFDE